MNNYKKLMILQLQATKDYIKKISTWDNESDLKLIFAIERQINTYNEFSKKDYIIYDQILSAIDDRISRKENHHQR